MSLNLKTGVTWSNLYHPFIDSFGAKNAGQGNEHQLLVILYADYWFLKSLEVMDTCVWYYKF